MSARSRCSLLSSLLAAVVMIASGNLVAAEFASSRYPFKVDPIQTISALTLVPRAKVPEQFFAERELALLRDAKRGSLTSMSLGEALLLASGATNDDDRRRYMRQLDQITDDARLATAPAKSSPELGRLLLKFLHDGPMAKGFEGGQANLITLLKTQRFNCVSSAALFTIVGQHLGLKVRVIEIPEHVFCEVFDGKKWVDVEPGMARGFAVKPDRKVIADIKARHGYRDGSPQAAEFRYRVNDLQFVAVLYFCHGTRLGIERQYRAGVTAKLFALALDPQNPHAIASTEQEIGRWCDGFIAGNNNGAALNLAHRYEHVLKNPSLAKSLIVKASKQQVQQVAIAQ